MDAATTESNDAWDHTGKDKGYRVTIQVQRYDEKSGWEGISQRFIAAGTLNECAGTALAISMSDLGVVALDALDQIP